MINVLPIYENIGYIPIIASLALLAIISVMKSCKDDPYYFVVEKSQSLLSFLTTVQSRMHDDDTAEFKRPSARIPTDIEMSLDQAFHDAKNNGFQRNWTSFLTYVIAYGLNKFDGLYREKADLIYSCRTNRIEKARKNLYLKELYKRINKAGFHSDSHVKFTVSIETLGRVSEYKKYLKTDNTDLYVAIFALALRDYPVDKVCQPVERYVEAFDTMVEHLLKMDELGEGGDGKEIREGNRNHV